MMLDEYYDFDESEVRMSKEALKDFFGKFNAEELALLNKMFGVDDSFVNGKEFGALNNDIKAKGGNGFTSARTDVGSLDTIMSKLNYLNETELKYLYSALKSADHDLGVVVAYFEFEGLQPDSKDQLLLEEISQLKSAVHTSIYSRIAARRKI